MNCHHIEDTRHRKEIRRVSLKIMTTDHILALLVGERDKITKAIEALQGTTMREERPAGSGRKAAPPSVEPDSIPGTVGPAAPAKRKLSAAGRRAIIAATKKRWAAVKAAKAAAATPSPVAAMPKAAPAKTPVGAKHKSSSAKDAAFRKKMSERMKAAWAARKKKAAAK
jgi:hypothetical protein